MTPGTPRPGIKFRDHCKHQAARFLLGIQQKPELDDAETTDPLCPSDAPIRVVCIADTHNHQPTLPPGDVLIHAGDLTKHGSFTEVQAGIAWLSSQPFLHKILVAGNHDVLFDDAFLARHPKRRYGDGRTASDLDFGTVTYLQDSSATLSFHGTARTLKVFGTPWTPKYSASAFQYHPQTAQKHWSRRLPSPLGESLHGSHAPPLDILVVHGPPRLHLDNVGPRSVGCPDLAAAIVNLKPRLVVYGHIHGARGREDGVVLDGVRRRYELVLNGRAGWWCGVLPMALAVVWGWLVWILVWPWRRVGVAVVVTPTTTTFVNAAMAGVSKNVPRHEAIIVEL